MINKAKLAAILAEKAKQGVIQPKKPMGMPITNHPAPIKPMNTNPNIPMANPAMAVPNVPKAPGMAFPKVKAGFADGGMIPTGIPPQQNPSQPQPNNMINQQQTQPMPNQFTTRPQQRFDGGMINDPSYGHSLPLTGPTPSGNVNTGLTQPYSQGGQVKATAELDASKNPMAYYRNNAEPSIKGLKGVAFSEGGTVATKEKMLQKEELEEKFPMITKSLKKDERGNKDNK